MVYGYKDGMWTACGNKPRGQYLQVTMTGTQEYFCVAENTSGLIPVIICAAAAVIVIVLLAAMKKKKDAQKKRKQKDADSD